VTKKINPRTWTTDSEIEFIDTIGQNLPGKEGKIKRIKLLKNYLEGCKVRIFDKGVSRDLVVKHIEELIAKGLK